MSRGRARNTPTVIRLEPILVDERAAAEALGIGTSSLRNYVAQGILPPPRKIRGSSRWLVDELRAAAALLPISDLPCPASRAAAKQSEGDDA